MKSRKFPSRHRRPHADRIDILRAARLNRLSATDRATGQVVRRYEHPYPGSLVHVDVKKIGNIPDGGRWRYVGARQGAVSWFNARGVTVERVLSDNGAAYRSHAWQTACQQLGIKAKRTRPYRPQTNGKKDHPCLTNKLFSNDLGDASPLLLLWHFLQEYSRLSA